MKNGKHWILLLASTLIWGAISILSSPMQNGEDVMIFRDAGWSLVSSGSFESSGLIYMHDTAPHFFAHYTPLMPLLFAGYLEIFPRNGYAGTMFNFLLGVVSAALALFLVHRVPYPGAWKKWAARLIAIFPIAFIRNDRPEAICYILFCLTILYTLRKNAHPVLCGLLISLVFLAHPFGGGLAGIWVACIFLLKNREDGSRVWSKTVLQTVVAGTTAFLVLGTVAFVYHTIDPTSLARFEAHALGINSGAGRPFWSLGPVYILKNLPGIATLRAGLPGLMSSEHIAGPGLLAFFLVWTVIRYKRLAVREKILCALCVFSIVIAEGLFPYQGHYLLLLVYLIPTLFLMTGQPGDQTLQYAYVALALAVVFVSTVSYLESQLFRLESHASYVASRSEPDFLRAHLASPDAVVMFANDDYDLYKQDFSHLVNAYYSKEENHLATENIDAVANCYGGFADKTNKLRPMPYGISATDFDLVEPTPSRVWITVLGRRIMNTQSGFGCDLYVRKKQDRTALK